jgi:hypothetical protein
MFERISPDLYDQVQTIKKLSLNLPPYLSKKIISTGNLGEILACHFMGWELVTTVNFKGADARSEKGDLIQIKTFVEGNKTKMLPGFDPYASKNQDVAIIAIVVLTENLDLKEVLYCQVSDYAEKLMSVEAGREIRKKGTIRTHRCDLQIGEFRSINNLKTEPADIL